MSRGKRHLLLALLLAAAAGFAAGWLARASRQQTFEQRMYDAEQRLRRKVNDATRSAGRVGSCERRLSAGRRARRAA